MKKYITLFLIQTVLCSSILAQKIIFKEDFNSFNNTIPNWNTTFHSGPNGWAANEMYLVAGSTVPNCLCYNTGSALSYRRVAGISDCHYKGGNQNNNNVLMYTPAIDLTGHANVVLKFDSYFKQKTDGIYTERATVELSTDHGATWNVISSLPANTNPNEFTTLYLDLSVYAGYNDVRIGFRYSDNGGDLSGWDIDDVMVFEPVNTDIQLVSVTPTDSLLGYATLNTGIPHTFKIANAGRDTIHQFTINYLQENKTVRTDTIKNVNILSFSTQSFVHKTPDTIANLGATPLTAWVSLAGDTLHWNDTLRTKVYGAYFMPQKIVALEEGTATWNGYCTPGLLYMKQLSSPGYNACQVSVHDTDPMMTTRTKDYSDFLYNLDQNFTPYFLLDRRFPADGNTLLEQVQKRQEYFGYADINIDPKIEGNLYKVGINIRPAIDLYGDYRAELVITEDDVSGTSKDWDQANAYANGALGPMGGYETKPDPILAADMKYQYVARAIIPSAEGVTNLPTTMIHNTIYSLHFDAVLDPAWNKNKLRANVFLLRQSDSTIINTNKVLFYLDVPKTAAPFNDALLYPNPSTAQTTLQFSTANSEDITVQVTDISGRMLVNNPAIHLDAGKHYVAIATSQLSPGIYIVNIISDEGRKALKMQVIH